MLTSENFYSIPFAPDYGITEQGIIKHLKSNTIIKENTQSVDGRRYVTIKNSEGIHRIYAVVFILATVFIRLPDHLTKANARIAFKDGNPDNLAIDNLEWMNRGEIARQRCNDNLKASRQKHNIPNFIEVNGYNYYPFKVDCATLPGFYFIPFCDHPLVINDEGVIVNLDTMREIKHYVKRDNYNTVNLRFNGEYKTRYIHRLLAYVFLPVPDSLKKYKLDQLEVNHIDGNKKNNHLSNLEWVTPSGNQQHAIRTRLIKYEQVLARHVLTGTLTLFRNATECAKAFGISAIRLRRHLKSPKAGRITKNWHVFITAVEGAVFPILTELEKEENTWDADYGIWIAFHVETNKTVLANTKAEMFSNLNVEESVIKTLKEDEFFYEGWLIRFDDNPAKDVVNTLKGRHVNQDIYEAKAVTIEDTFTGLIKTYESGVEAAKDIGINQTTIYYRFKKGRNSSSLIKNRYRIIF